MNQKAPKVSVWKYLLYYIIGMIPFYIFASAVYPVNENNELVMPDHVTMILVTAPIVISWALGKIEKARKQKKFQQSYIPYQNNREFTDYKKPFQQHGPTVTKMMEKFEREEKEFEEEMRLMRERFEKEMLFMKQTAAELQWRQQASGLSYTDFELSRIDNMDGPMFEQWCADLLKKCGYENVSVSGKSGDQGVDIIAEKDDIRYAIQCKCYSSPLGNTPVQEVYAGKTKHNCFIAAVMTNNYFTRGAKDLAAATNVLLWDRDKLKKMLDNSSKA